MLLEFVGFINLSLFYLYILILLEFVGFYIYFNETRICEFFKFVLILFILFNDTSICKIFIFILIIFIHFNKTKIFGI